MNPTEESKDLSINSVTRSQHRHGWRARGLRSAFLLSAALAISQTTGAASADLKTKKLGPIGSVQIRDAADVPVGSYVGLESIRSSTYPIVAFDAPATGAEVMPIDCTQKLKLRPSSAGWSKSSTSTGKPMVPPPIGVEPAT